MIIPEAYELYTRKTFGSIRKVALQQWETLHSQGRPYECNWHVKGFHVNTFCSMADYTYHVVDLLTDKRFDKCDFLKFPVYRFYSRVFDYCCEILEDLTELYRIAKPEANKNVARKQLAGGTNDIINLSCYRNTILKHKSARFHPCNYHLPFYYEDLITKMEEPAISIYNVTDDSIYSKAKSILVPHLTFGIKCLEKAYSHIDSVLKTENQSVKRIISRQLEYIPSKRKINLEKKWKFEKPLPYSGTMAESANYSYE